MVLKAFWVHLQINCGEQYIGVARIFDWRGQTLKNLAVFTEIESDFSAEIGNSNDFSAQIQVISKKKK